MMARARPVRAGSRTWLRIAQVAMRGAVLLARLGASGRGRVASRLSGGLVP